MNQNEKLVPGNRHLKGVGAGAACCFVTVVWLCDNEALATVPNWKDIP